MSFCPTSYPLCVLAKPVAVSVASCACTKRLGCHEDHWRSAEARSCSAGMCHQKDSFQMKVDLPVLQLFAPGKETTELQFRLLCPMVASLGFS